MSNYDKLTVEQALAILQQPIGEDLKAEIRRAKQLEFALHKIVTSDNEMLKVKERIVKLAPLEHSVLIEGETGTGKTYIAEALHGYRMGRFISVNCSAIPENLIESELFGHIAGAFTGAIKDRDGKFIAANRGTIFLDEIGDMPLLMQCKLLITLQKRTITPVGSNDEKPFTCRVIAATNKDIKKLIEEGKFREDLYYRLATFKLHTTALRYRPNDIIEALNTVYDKDKKIPEDIRGMIKGLELKGNYRELEAIVLRYKELGEYEV